MRDDEAHPPDVPEIETAAAVMSVPRPRGWSVHDGRSTPSATASSSARLSRFMRQRSSQRGTRPTDPGAAARTSAVVTADKLPSSQ